MWTLERNLDASTLVDFANPVSPPRDRQSSMYGFAKHSTKLSVPAITDGRHGSCSSLVDENNIEQQLGPARNTRHSLTATLHNLFSH